MKENWKWFIYVIECLDGTYYTGCTWNIETRLEQHLANQGSKYTKKHGAYKLVYHEKHESLETARMREKQIKNWSQKKKRNLISGKWKSDW